MTQSTDGENAIAFPSDTIRLISNCIGVELLGDDDEGAGGGEGGGVEVNEYEEGEDKIRGEGVDKGRKG
ncbi:hypothetical protein DCAR_0206644 [Daucus carota subsp. sativus]|uniref:Uncharacterized protein n=1 Tax=Daucus carota subsp. sativus TaxID=79200 RepID=A0A162AH97_DAUCS|nr:hypothetical protein DCAR_0206644 [Daucus carota subsp. sativus]